MDEQHRKILGYRKLSETEIAAMNQIKELGPHLETLIDRLKNLSADPRWINIGESHLQQGLMALTRAVAKPYSF